jgi:hypothetical protein
MRHGATIATPLFQADQNGVARLDLRLGLIDRDARKVVGLPGAKALDRPLENGSARAETYVVTVVVVPRQEPVAREGRSVFRVRRRP